MSDRHGVLGGIFDNDEVLWFIILFLLLFWGNHGIGGFGCDKD